MYRVLTRCRLQIADDLVPSGIGARFGLAGLSNIKRVPEMALGAIPKASILVFLTNCMADLA